MIRLTAKMVTEMHGYIIETEGGEPGIRDMGTLEYLIDNINYEQDLFKRQHGRYFWRTDTLFGMGKSEQLFNFLISS